VAEAASITKNTDNRDIYYFSHVLQIRTRQLFEPSNVQPHPSASQSAITPYYKSICELFRMAMRIGKGRTPAQLPNVLALYARRRLDKI
jgi:hypothetical protein